MLRILDSGDRRRRLQRRGARLDFLADLFADAVARAF
ncbi:MAG: hypothetical protein ACK5MY_12100 [Jhaorihella sp.]